MTVDSEEHATRFIKDLFKYGLVSQVQMFDNNFERGYLKFGRPSTERTRVRLEMVVDDANVKKVIEFVNNHNPTLYDYPKPDIVFIPITNGNTEYIEWARNSRKIDFKGLE